ncbi:MAG: hypothetical protein RBG13Loki_2650 [Promethearchaeota archaeon CR_4]|nr:MAG: hypothetical protein RBG13Loki_2650 [Candidatus Lokiarchaeota archaeon CR_4]
MNEFAGDDLLGTDEVIYCGLDLGVGEFSVFTRAALQGTQMDGLVGELEFLADLEEIFLDVFDAEGTRPRVPVLFRGGAMGAGYLLGVRRNEERETARD